MSHVIEYDRQFIKSDEGFTPVWLAGESNVTELHKGKTRLARDWSLFHNFLGMSETEMVDAVTPLTGGYNEHWTRKGKWVDDAGLIRWIRSGCAKAATIEEIMEANKGTCVSCHLTVWENEMKTRVTRIYVDFDEENETAEQWVKRVIDRVKEFREKTPDEAFYPESPVLGVCSFANVQDASTRLSSDDSLEFWGRKLLTFINLNREVPLPKVYIVNYAERLTSVCNHKMHETVTTTAAFDAWIQKARAAIRDEYPGASPIVRFHTENLRHPIRTKAEQVLIKHKNCYLYAISDGNVTHWTRNAGDALVFDSEEAKELITNASPLANLGKVCVVSANAKNKPWNYVLQFKGGRRDGHYVYQNTGKTLAITPSLNLAKRYADYKAAETAKSRIGIQFNAGEGVEVVKI